jgi:hypothetical protein
MFTKIQNKNFKIHGYVALTIVVVMSVFFAKNYVNPTSVKDSFCDVTNQTCSFVLDGQTVSVYFQKPPQIEEQSILHIEGIGPDSIEGVSIQGVNMYMGTIPVVPDEKHQSKWTGWTFLGACSEPKMQWELLIEINGREGTELGRLRFKTSVD